MNRAEHLAWAKKRALEYVEMERPAAAISSMVSDVQKHEELDTKGVHMYCLWAPLGGTPDQVRHWIDGFK